MRNWSSGHGGPAPGSLGLPQGQIGAKREGLRPPGLRGQRPYYGAGGAGSGFADVVASLQLYFV